MRVGLSAAKPTQYRYKINPRSIAMAGGSGDLSLEEHIQD